MFEFLDKPLLDRLAKVEAENASLRQRFDCLDGKHVWELTNSSFTRGKHGFTTYSWDAEPYIACKHCGFNKPAPKPIEFTKPVKPTKKTKVQ